MNGLNAFKGKAKIFISIFLCFSLIFGEVVLFPMASKAESISQGNALLDISIGEEFLIEDGDSSVRQFPFLAAYGNDVFACFSQHNDAYVDNALDAVKISRDGGLTWTEYVQDTDFYLSSLIKLKSGNLFGLGYPGAYFTDSRHCTVKYVTSSDNGKTWEKHTGTATFPQDIFDLDNSGWASMLFHRTMMEMEDGSIQGLMYGKYVGDTGWRTIWVKSTDGGENWSVVSDVAVPSGKAGEPTTYCEPVVARCSDGSLLCVMRVGNAPLYQCRSNDNGLTWSKPEQIPGVTATDAYSVDADLCLMSNGVLVLSYGRPNCKMLFSPDGTGREWKYLTPTYTGNTSGYTGIREIAPGKLLLIGDKGTDWMDTADYEIWGKYVYVNKTNVALEEGIDAGYVEINGNTYTAVPYEGNEFLGWYNKDGELVSKNITETFTEGLYTPKIKNNSKFETPGFEYAELGSAYTKDPNNATYPNWYASADWAKVNVVTSEGFNSNKSLEFFTQYRNDCYTDISGLIPNTDYTVSYSWMMRDAYTEKNQNCFGGMIVSGTQYSTTSEAYPNRLGGDYGSYSPEADVWKTHSFTFNTGNSTSVRIFVEYASHPQAVSNLFLDNFTIAKIPEPLSVSLESGTDAGYITNNGNTYTAVPYDGNKFLGWYSKDTLISKSLTYTFSDNDGAITAKFKNNSVFASPGYETAATGNVHYYEDSTTAEGWHIGPSWGKAMVIKTEGGHSGSNYLALMARYQTNTYTNLNGLKPNTDYTVSYYWKMEQGYNDTSKNIYYGMIAAGTNCSTSGEAWGQKLGHAYGAQYPEADTWKKETFTFNTGDLTSVRLFLDYESALNSGYVYIDEFTVFETPKPLSVSLESGTDAGYFTNDGNTYTATPYEGNEFLGWYSEDELVSNELTETFSDTDGSITAKFKNNSIFASPGYETATTGNVHYYEDSTTAEGWHIGPSWGKAMVIKTEGGHSGSNYLALMARYQTNTYTNLNGLKPNTDYTVSYYWKMEQGYNDTSKNIYYGMIAAGTNCSTSGEAWGQKLGHAYGAQYPEADTWKKETFTFNTGDLTSVRLFLDYESALSSGYVYIDEFTVFEIPEPLSVSTESEMDAGYITNIGTVYTAVPYDGNEFLGWYNSEGVISTEMTYDFADTNGNVTAKFKNNSIFQSPSYELSALGNIIYHENSKTAEGWHAGADWASAKIVNEVARSGENSLALFARYQGDVYTNLIGLKPNTNYTVSYYWMMKEPRTETNNNLYSGMVVSSTEYDTTAAAYQNNIGGSYGAYYPEGGVWQKDTFNFNTGDLTSVRLFVEYSSSNATLYIDDFTVFEVPENLLNYDADLNSGKLVNGGGAATITEVDTISSDPNVLGNKVYSLNTSADFAVGYSSDTMSLKSGKRYDLSLYLKVADGHTMLTADDAGQYITLYMKSDNNDNNRIALNEPYTLTIDKLDGKKIIFNSQADEFSLDKTHVSNAEGEAIWIKITASFTPADDTLATLAVRPNAAGTIYMDKIMVTSAEDAESEIKAALSTVGTAIRTTGTQALRFKSAIEKSAISKLYFDTYELVEYGSIAIKTEYLGGKELVIGDYTQSNGTVQSARIGSAYIKNQHNIVFADTGSTIQFTAALTGITEKNYNSSYSVRTYAVLQRPDGTTFTVYDDNTVIATVYEIAVLAYNAEGNNNDYAESPEVREYLFNNIINKMNF